MRRSEVTIIRTKVVDLEISEKIVPIPVTEGYDRFWILVRYHRRPLGWARISLASPNIPVFSAEILRQEISNQLGWILLGRVFLGRQFSPEQLDQRSQPISVVICTRDRSQQLAGCLKTLLALDYPTFEIIVVDNAPSNNDTAQLAANLPVRYVREERPGLNHARNRGITEARYNLLAFTDDDARVDRFWLEAINRGFAAPQVMAVTGFVGPAELETEAQYQFESGYGGMGHGFWSRTIRWGDLTKRELIWASSFGAGVNMAFRRVLFSTVGSFDVALDLGTPSAGGGDVEMFHRIVAKGYTILYEPAMLVWHTHRRDFSHLRRQLYDNGRGFGCYLFTCLRNRTVKPFSVLSFLFQDWLCKWILRNLIRPPGELSRKLVLAELAGMLTSPLAYRSTQAWARHITSRFSESFPEGAKTHEHLCS